MISLLMRYAARLPLKYPKGVIGVSLALMCIALAFVPRLHISTDRNLLSGKNNQEFRRREEVNAMFGTSLMAVIILSGKTSQQVQAAADKLSVALKNQPEQVKEVFHRADIDFFERHGLMFADTAVIEKLVAFINSDSIDLEAFDDMDGLPSMIQAAATFLEDQPLPEDSSPEKVKQGLETFKGLLDDLDIWFTGPEKKTFGIVERMLQLGPSTTHEGVDAKGYLIENDGKKPHLAIMFVQPRNDSQGMDVVTPFTDTLRAEAAKVSAQSPGLKALVTGMPPLQADELKLITKDCIVAGFAAGIGVLLVFILAFRSFRISLFLVLPLGVGLIWSAGFTGAVYGHLTMITSYFAAVLFGLGVPFTIHIVSRFHEALREGMSKEKALEVALTKAGPGVVVGGITSAVAFMAIALSEFQGFAEMGVISGVGVALILIANLTLLPAVMLIWHPGIQAVTVRKKTGIIWKKLTRTSVIIPVATVILIIVGVFTVRWIKFDYAVENMLPPKAEAVLGINILDERTAFTSTYSIAVASSLEEAEKLRKKFEALSTVERAEAISMFVPREQESKVTLLAKIDSNKRLKIKEIAQDFTKRSKNVGGCTSADLSKSLLSLGDTLEDLSFDAKKVDRPEAENLSALSTYAKKISTIIGQSKNDERAGRLEKQIFEMMTRGLNILAQGIDDKGFMIKDLPSSIRGRYVSADHNNFAVLIFPTGDIGQKDFFYKHVNEILSVDSKTTGHPVTHKRFTEMVHKGFFEAVLLSGLAVIILVLLDLRSFKGLVLGLAPLLVAAGWTAAVMYGTGFNFNYANLMALPILIGTGVDYGVHLAHRAKQEGSVTIAAQTTGRAIALSGLTTLIGFGSLILGNHWGVRSLGLVLLLGITASLVATLIVLPGMFSDSNKVKKRG